MAASVLGEKEYVHYLWAKRRKYIRRQTYDLCLFLLYESVSNGFDDLCLFLLYESVSNDQTKEKRKENMSGIVHGLVGLSQV